MKKIVFFLFLFGTFTSYAQPLEKLIRKAFDRGADSKGVYVLENVKNISLSESDAVAYLRDRKGYVVLSSSSKVYERFGYEEKIFDKVRFLNGAEGYKIYNKCNNVGAFYHPNNNQEARKNIWGSVLYTTPLATRMSDVAWSGKVVNGLLHGNGIGVLVFSNGWCAIKCEFQYGIPISKPEIIFSLPSNLNYSAQFPFPRDYEDNRKLMLVQTYDASTDQKLRWAITENLKVYFKEDVRSVVDSEYTKALTLNNLKNMNYNDKKNAIYKLRTKEVLWRQSILRGREYKTVTNVLDNAIVKLNKFVDDYENRVNDSLGWISKAKEVIYVYNLAQYYEAVVPSQQFKRGFSRNIGVYPYMDGTKFDIERVRKCIATLNSVKEKRNDRNSPFYDFYNAIYPDIKASEKWINEELEDALVEDWRRYIEMRRQQQAEDHRKYMSEMCDKCKIDGKRSTIPEGYEPEDTNWLWGHPARSEKAGNIIFQNGNTAKWRYVYENGKATIEVSGYDYNGEYKSEKEMWDDLLYQCKSRYCR